MKTVLITGVCGIVGAAVAQALSAAGTKVVGVDMADSLPFEDDDLDFRGGIDLTSEEHVQALADALEAQGVNGRPNSLDNSGER